MLRAGDVLVVNDTKVFPRGCSGRVSRAAAASRSAARASRHGPRCGARAPGAEAEAGGARRARTRGCRRAGHRGRDRRRTTDSAAAPCVCGRARRPRRGHRRRRPHSAAALHPSCRHDARSRALSDGLRARRGSIAAPTAGLHFTPELLDALEAGGVERAAVTLHVGYGTFKPVRVERVEEHSVDPERYTIDDRRRRASIARAPRAAGRSPSARPPRVPRIGRSVGGSVAGRRQGRHSSSVPGHADSAGRRPPHQLPPAAVVAADPGLRLRRPRASARAYRRGGRGTATASTATATRCGPG